MNTNEIIIGRDGNLWVATFCGPLNAEIADLFGTTTIPTAFTVFTPIERVVREIARLNPTYSVRVR